MKNCKILLLLTMGLTLCTTSASLVCAQEKVDSTHVIQYVTEEKFNREKMDMDYHKALEEAAMAIKEKDFGKAEFIYTKTLVDLLDQMGHAADQYRHKLKTLEADLNEIWAESDVNASYDYQADGKLDFAIDSVNKAYKRVPKASYDARIKRLEALRKSNAYVFETSLEVSDVNRADREFDVEKLLAQAKILMDKREWIPASKRCEKVLKKDPTNPLASYYLERIYREINTAYKFRAYADAIEASVQIMGKWVPPFPQDAITRSTKALVTTSTSVRSEIYNKLQNIRIKNVQFERLPYRDAFMLLSDYSKESSDYPEGVVIGMHNYTNVKDSTISLNLSDVPLKTLLDYITIQTGLKWRIQARDVVFGDEEGQEEKRIYDVRRSFIEYVKTLETGEAPEDADAEDGAQKPAELARQEAEALKQYFIKRGAAFGSKASVVYEKRSGKLLVINTLPNQALIEAIINKVAGRDNPLVSIESRFLEVQQAHLEQFGFHWFLSQAIPKIDPANPNGTNGSQNEGESTNTMPKNDDIVRVMNKDPTKNEAFNPLFSATLIPNGGPDKNINLELAITALDQNDKGEILFAPKITVESGSEGVIEMITEEYYPQTWSAAELTTQNDNVAMKPSIPEFGTEPSAIGVILKVTPDVQPNSDVILLKLNPTVTAFVDWQEYIYSISIPANTGKSVATPQTIRMPNISRREFETTMRVHNGETVVMGGILQDREVVSDYAYPILGDLPFVGRFFKDILEVTEKANLLIYVTAKKLDTKGRPIPPTRVNEDGERVPILRYPGTLPIER